jgi:hypothetical protein
MYLNTDLEVRSSKRLDVLIEALGDRVFVQHHARVGREWLLSLSHRDSGLDRSAERTIARWIELLRTLRGQARTALRDARAVASIGVDEGKAPHTTVRIEAGTTATLARLGVGIEVVVYGRSMQRRGKPTRVGTSRSTTAARSRRGVA